VTVRELLGEQAGGTVAGYEVGAPAAQPVAAGAPQRAAAAGGAADAGGWVEMRPGETPAATSSREERKSRSKRGQRQEEDAGEWVEAPPQGRSK
jgi:hypothetical protein